MLDINDKIKIEVKLENYNIHNDYFIFDHDDIELSFLRRRIEKNMKTFKLSQIHKEEAIAYYNEIMLIFDKTDFNYLTFPYLKSALTPTLASIKDRLENNAQKGYFLILLFSNLSRIRFKLNNFYNQNIKKNGFGLPKNFESLIDKDLIESSEYSNLVRILAQWYVKNEFIFFFLQFLEEFFEIRLNFNENEFSIEKNYGFDLKIFMKKSFYKLSAYLLSKLSVYSKSFFLNRAVATVNSKNLLILLLGTFTYGVSLNKIIDIDFKPLALIGGLFFQYLIGNVAHTFENQSCYIEITNITEILYKLNKKVEKIKHGLFDLIKVNIFEMFETNEMSIYILKEKIRDISSLLQKYMKNVKDIDFNNDKELIYHEEIINNFKDNSSGDWLLITLNK